MSAGCEAIAPERTKANRPPLRIPECSRPSGSHPTTRRSCPHRGRSSTVTPLGFGAPGSCSLWLHALCPLRYGGHLLLPRRDKMTTLICWVAVDPNGPSALYFASDSRISWGAGREWDVSRKLFAARSHPDIFGYYGEVLSPSLLLGQVIEAIDAGYPSPCVEGFDARCEAITGLIKDSIAERRRVPRHDFGIIHATRVSESMALSKLTLWSEINRPSLKRRSKLTRRSTSAHGVCSPWVGSDHGGSRATPCSGAPP